MKELFTEEELDKLPKWARSKAEGIQRENEELGEAIDAMNGTVADTPYSARLKHGYGTGGQKEVEQLLDAPYGIDIKLPSKFPDAKINVRLKDGQLHVSANGYPSSLVVSPQSSNIVNIAVVQKPYELGD